MAGVLLMLHKGFSEEKGQEGKERLEFMKLCLERGDKPVKSLWKRVTRHVSVTYHLILKRKPSRKFVDVLKVISYHK